MTIFYRQTEQDHHAHLRLLGCTKDYDGQVLTLKDGPSVEIDLGGVPALLSGCERHGDQQVVIVTMIHWVKQ